MGRPQPGLFVEETAEHLHVEWLLPADLPAATVVEAVGAARRDATTLRGPNLVWGFAPSLWNGLSVDGCPENLQDFGGISGPGGTAPATQRSVWLWVAGNAWEKVWQTARAADAHLSGIASDRYELHAFTPIDNRDPTGFIDGTENPEIDEALEVALYPDGGSAVLVQKWVHDLRAFESLSVAEQEAVFGRTKSDSQELAEDVMPPTSHVSRNVIEDADGEELHIFRRNTPFASVSEAGTMYIGASGDPARTDLMLARMFGATGDGLIDHLTRFSKAVSGSYYFVPSMEGLTQVFGSLDEDPEPEAGARERSDLGIGDLRHLAEAPGPQRPH
jgi:porphyrinogen peroxidase